MRRPALTSIWVTGILGALSGVSPMSIDMQLPALPIIADSLKTTADNSQLTIGMFLVGFAVAQIFYGPLSDRYGRRPVLLWSLLLYLIASIICLVAPTIEILIGGRFLQGAGGCAGMVIARAIARDIHGPSMARVMSFIAAIMGIAPILAPVIGGGVLLFGDWRAIFAVLLGLLLLLSIVVFFFLEETNNHKDPTATRLRPLLANFGVLCRNRDFMGYGLISAALFGCLFAFISGFPFVMNDGVGASASMIGVSFGIAMLGNVGGALFSAKVANSWSPARILISGMMALLTALVVLLVVSLLRPPGYVEIVIPMVLFMAAFAFTLPSTFSGALAPFEKMAGSASSLLGVLQWIGGAGAGFVVVALHDGTARPMAYVMGGLVIVALAIFVVVIKPTSKAAPM